MKINCSVCMMTRGVGSTKMVRGHTSSAAVMLWLSKWGGGILSQKI